MKTIKQQFDTIDFFIIISQDQGFTYSISAKALTHPLSQVFVLQRMRNQTLQHLSTLRLEPELEPGCFLLLKLFPKQLNKWELFNVFNFCILLNLTSLQKYDPVQKPLGIPSFDLLE